MAEITTIQDAYAAAKEQLASGDAPPVEAETDAEVRDETPPVAEPAADVIADLPPKAAEAAGLLTDEEFTALQVKHKDDPAALRRELLGDYTRKTQKLADERKAADRFKPYAPLIDAWETDKEGTLRALAKENGYEIVSKAAAPPVANEVDTLMAQFKSELGPDLEFLADGLTPALTKLVERLTTQTIEPLKKQQQVIIDRTAQEQSEATMKSFSEKHPDWQAHEPAMLALSQSLSPKGLKEGDYLERLYQLATYDTWEKDRSASVQSEAAKIAKAAIEKINKGAAGDRRVPATVESQVRRGAPKDATVREAYEAAKRGETWDDD